MRSTLENKLYAELAKSGYSVAPMTGYDRTVQARLDAEENTLWLNTKLSDSQRIACLAHELIHIKSGHAVCQAPSIECIVDEKAALMLVDLDEYATAENIYGANPAMIAQELDWPLWVIEAFQRYINKFPDFLAKRKTNY